MKIGVKKIFETKILQAKQKRTFNIFIANRGCRGDAKRKIYVCGKPCKNFV